MSLIFPSGPGRVVAIRSAGVPIIIRPQGWNSDVFRAIITSIGIRDGCNFQISRSLRRIIYVYSFGDRESDIMLGGTTFAYSCSSGLAGIEGVNLYFHTYKMTNYADPILLAIGSNIVRRCLLHSCDNSLNDPSTGMGQFTFGFVGLQ